MSGKYGEGSGGIRDAAVAVSGIVPGYAVRAVLSPAVAGCEFAGPSAEELVEGVEELREGCSESSSIS